MSCFATADNVRSEGNLPASIKAEKITPSIIKSSIEIKKLITEEKYSAILGYSDSEEPEEKQQYDELIIAEANLAMSYAVPVLNIETQGTGIVRSKGWDQSRSDLLSQNEVDTLSSRFREIAMGILQPYLRAYEGDPETTEDDDDVFRSGNFTLSVV